MVQKIASTIAVLFAAAIYPIANNPVATHQHYKKSKISEVPILSNVHSEWDVRDKSQIAKTLRLQRLGGASSLAPIKPAQPSASMAMASKFGAIKWVDCGKFQVEGAYRVIGQGSGVTTGTCNGLTAINIYRVGVEIRGDNAVLSNFRLIHADKMNVSPDLPEGVQVKTGKNVTIRDGHVWGFRMLDVPGKYRNGDGYVVESGVGPVHFQNVESVESGDSSFDLLKGHDITGDKMIGRSSDRCVKIGALNVHIGLLRCSGMRKEVLTVYTTKEIPFIGILTYDFNQQIRPINIISMHKGANIEIGRCVWIGIPPAGTKLVAGDQSGEIKLGSGCKL